ncbi:MAG: dTDP-4-dehydrorhamnose reductase [Xanthomonadaceae bacterium]|nr:dTDP-4-dehydrorhamnose reductase [Xanthomonadaceae bacterium]
MSILLFGADGQVGFELHRSLSAQTKVIATSRSGRLPGSVEGIAIDFAQPGQAADLVRRLRPRWVVNAAAYTAVDQAEDEPALAMRVNAEAVGEIAAACADTDANLFHYSTDYVFAGDDRRPRREDDAVGPLGVYGRSKLAGEEAIRASGCRHIVLRTAWVYAARGRNFLRTMLRLAGEREELRVVDDQIGAPTPARWLADVSALILRAPGDACGTWHASAEGQCSWRDFAEAIMVDAQAAGVLARAPRVVGIASSEYPAKALRPTWSCLDCSRLYADFSVAPLCWRQGLRQVLGHLVG